MHGIEHATGYYLALLLLATLVAVLADKITGLPYTIALVIVGLAVALLGDRLGLRPPEEEGFSQELIFFVLLPPLLFQGALHMELNKLLDHIWPIFVFAILGVVISTVVIGLVMHFVGGMESLLMALLFGSMLCATDPVSVLALFRKAGVSPDLRHLVEGESLFNDGTSIVIFGILFEMVAAPIRGVTVDASVVAGILTFVKVAVGGLVLGAGLGFLCFLFLKIVDEPLIETTACLVLAMGAFWIAESIHFSGVISTVTAGLLVGNYGRRFSMSPRVTLTVENFFGVVDFLVNSLLFLLIGLEMQVVGVENWLEHLPLVGAGILGLLVSRAVAVYPCFHMLNLAGTRRPGAWAHVLFWGGIRGSIPVALLMSLSGTLPEEVWQPLVVAGFGVVLFSLVVQGLTIQPLVDWLRLGGYAGEED